MPMPVPIAKTTRFLRLLAMIALALSVRAALALDAPRTTVAFDKGWRFQTGVLPAASAAQFDDTAWESIALPHNFPVVEKNYNRFLYRGEAWYRKAFTTPPEWKSKRVFLRFDGVNLVSNVYLNGELLGEHRGGFAAFTYELTGKLKDGAANQLSVRVDSSKNQDVAPIEDSLLNGGIYRHVSLIVTGPVDISPIDYSSPGVFLTLMKLDKDKALVQVKTEVDNALAESKAISVRMLLIDGAGKPLFKVTAAGQVAPKKMTAVDQVITIPNPHLWNGLADPYLYKVRIDLMDGDQVLDTMTQPLGLRAYSFDRKKGFVLNGVGRQIHGVCLHQDYGTMGWTTGPTQEEEDLRTLREMGADGLRLVHYQHSQSALDLYDRTGMVIWSELPVFGRVGTSAAFAANAKEQLYEMIRQNYNHPSIVMWSLSNEVDSKNVAISTQIMKDLNAIAHKEDPSRRTVLAAHGDTLDHEHEMVAAMDLIAENQYPGWYWGKPGDLGMNIDRYDTAYGDRGISVSEYGGGAKIGDHKQGLNVTDEKPINPYGNFQPEEWQALVHEGNYAAIKARPSVWGSFIWLAFDSGGTPRKDGTIDGGNIKGMVTQDRKVRKDAYFFYQANWSPKPMVYLTSRRDVNRTEADTAVKVYSNAASVTLTVNGKSYGAQKPDELHIARWKKITLDPGANKVELSGPDGLHDEAVWNYTGAAAPKP